MDERQWIHAIQKGDKRHLQDIAEKYYDDIFRFCAFQTGSKEEAYDLAQETFLRFIRYVESYHDRNLKGYLLAIARNVCRNYLAAQRKAQNTTLPLEDNDKYENYGRIVTPPQTMPPSAAMYLEDGGSAPEGHVLQADIHSRLMDALAQLPDMQRETLLLHYVHGMKYREIGQRTGVGVSTVKSRARQGMERLQSLLRKEDFLD